MEISEEYVIYELNNILVNIDYKSLRKVESANWKNSFNTKKKAIQALIDDSKFYEDYIILKHYYIAHS